MGRRKDPRGIGTPTTVRLDRETEAFLQEDLAMMVAKGLPASKSEVFRRWGRRSKEDRSTEFDAELLEQIHAQRAKIQELETTNKGLERTLFQHQKLKRQRRTQAARQILDQLQHPDHRARFQSQLQELAAAEATGQAALEPLPILAQAKDRLDCLTWQELLDLVYGPEVDP